MAGVKGKSGRHKRDVEVKGVYLRIPPALLKRVGYCHGLLQRQHGPKLTQNTAFGGCQGHISADVYCLTVTPATMTTGAVAIVNGTVEESTGIYAIGAPIGSKLNWKFTDFPSPTQDQFAGDQVADNCVTAPTATYVAESGNVIVKTGS